MVNAASRASGAAQSALSTKRAHLTAPRSYAAWAAQAAYASASASPVSASRSAGMNTNFHEFVLSMEMPLSWLVTLQSEGDVLLSVDVMRVSSDVGREEEVLRWTEPSPSGMQGKELREA